MCSSVGVFVFFCCVFVSGVGVSLFCLFVVCGCLCGFRRLFLDCVGGYLVLSCLLLCSVVGGRRCVLFFVFAGGSVLVCCLICVCWFVGVLFVSVLVWVFMCFSRVCRVWASLCVSLFFVLSCLCLWVHLGFVCVCCCFLLRVVVLLVCFVCFLCFCGWLFSWLLFDGCIWFYCVCWCSAAGVTFCVCSSVCLQMFLFLSGD